MCTRVVSVLQSCGKTITKNKKKSEQEEKPSHVIAENSLRCLLKEK